MPCEPTQFGDGHPVAARLPGAGDGGEARRREFEGGPERVKGLVVTSHHGQGVCLAQAMRSEPTDGDESAVRAVFPQSVSTVGHPPRGADPLFTWAFVRWGRRVPLVV
ncbi:hypothetical protein GCM10017673_04410 [Streptosporangium violaceochromogenes]|nr:hypothetical protein GCM10017673_04410 [Streptosporangium violaceochromogenes]